MQVDLSIKRNALFHQTILSLIFKANQNGIYNQIRFSIKNGQFENAQLILEFNQEIIENFEANLPKKMRGKTTPWWKNPDETIGMDQE